MKVLLRLIFVLFIIVTVTNKADNDLGTTGKIAGKISDAVTGDPLPFVNVIVLGTTIGGASDIDGNYSILNIPPGNYNVKASAIGYNAVTVTNVRVSIDLTTQVDFQLNETSLQLGQDVVVVATKPLIQKDLTASTKKGKL